MHNSYKNWYDKLLQNIQAICLCSKNIPMLSINSHIAFNLKSYFKPSYPKTGLIMVKLPFK